MKKLKTLLRSNHFYIILSILLFLYCFNYYSKKNNTNINLNDNKFIGRIISYKIDHDLLTLELSGSEKIVGYYYFKNESEANSFYKKYKYGDKVLLEGEFNLPKNNTAFNLFNYKKYLYYKHIYIIMNIDNLSKIDSNNIIIYKLKNIINDHIMKYKSKSYLETFILGNKSMIDISSYQNNGISHLLALSGMHVSILSLFIIFIFRKYKYNLILTSLFLILFMFLTGLGPSISRSVLLFSLLSINKLFKMDINIIKLFLLTVIILLFMNPYFIYDIGFLYSFSISFILILLKDKLNGSYLNKLFKVSFISFMVSLPITLYYFYEVNFLSIILNLFFVPFVSIIVFPLALVTFFIPYLDCLLLIVTNILESISKLTSEINMFVFIFGKVNGIFIIIYYLFLFLFLYSYKKKYIFLIILILFIQYNHNFLFSTNYFMMIDVGQGDSLLIHSNNKTMLLDTGGKINLPKKDWQRKNKSITDKTLIPLLKSLGIKRLDIMCFSHGDNDHLGEAINLVNNIKINKVLFNNGNINNNENRIINLLTKKKIKYKKVLEKEKFNIGKFKFISINKSFKDENDSSSIFLVNIYKYFFLLTGDASKVSEEYILSNYNLPDIDILKVGHHGSKTSSGIDFINEIKPRYSIISVGKNNRYGHPNKEVLDNLKDSIIYRTDDDGSIMFKIKNNKLKIETCSP